MAKKEYKKPLVYVQKGNGKKTYQSPKATVYKAEKPPKANSSGGGRRSYRSTPKFSTSVMSAVSLLLVIGLIATVFFAYENSTRAEGEAFQYFSPAKYLERMSNYSYSVYGQYVPVEYRLNGRIALSPAYIGVITIKAERYVSDGVKEVIPIELFSENRLTRYGMDRGGQFKFRLGGVTFNSYDMVDPNTEISYREVLVPNIEYDLLTPPDFDTVAKSFSEVDDAGSFFTSVGELGKFVFDWLGYQFEVISNLLPWNTIVSSDDIPDDKTPISIPWRE